MENDYENNLAKKNKSYLILGLIILIIAGACHFIQKYVFKI